MSTTWLTGNSVTASGLTAAGIIATGQLQIGQFPAVTTQDEFEALVETERSLAALEIQLAAPGAYASTEPGTASLVARAILLRTLAQLWQMVIATMVGYDAEALPPEYVEPERAADLRDKYSSEANRLIGLLDTSSFDPADPAGPDFDSVGLDQSDEYVPTLTDRLKAEHAQELRTDRGHDLY